MIVRVIVVGSYYQCLALKTNCKFLHLHRNSHLLGMPLLLLTILKLTAPANASAATAVVATAAAAFFFVSGDLTAPVHGVDEKDNAKTLRLLLLIIMIMSKVSRLMLTKMM